MGKSIKSRAKSNQDYKKNRQKFIDDLGLLEDLRETLVDLNFSERAQARILWIGKIKLCKKHEGIRLSKTLNNVKARNKATYNNVHGPDYDILSEKGLTDKEIIRKSLSELTRDDVFSTSFDI